MGSWLKSLSARALVRLVVAFLATFLLGRAAEANPMVGGGAFLLGFFLLGVVCALVLCWVVIVSIILTFESPRSPSRPEITKQAGIVMLLVLVLGIFLFGVYSIFSAYDLPDVRVLVAVLLSTLLIAGSHYVRRSTGPSWLGLRVAFWLPPLMLLSGKYVAGLTVSVGQDGRPTRVAELVTPQVNDLVHARGRDQHLIARLPGNPRGTFSVLWKPDGSVVTVGFGETAALQWRPPGSERDTHAVKRH